jgi:hypothetical protein
MSKHTPGEWKAIEGMNGWQVWADDIQIIDYVLEEADTRLIAAAPLLLAACIQAREFLKTIAHNTDDMDVLDAAIAAAEGDQ